MKFAVSNTVNAIILYMDYKAFEKLGSHVDVQLKGTLLYVRKGGGVNINDGKHNSTEINRSGQVQPRAHPTMQYFGKTEMCYRTDGDLVIIDLNQPVGGQYKKPKRAKGQAEPLNVRPSDEEIEQAVATINRLDRSVYQVKIDTTNNQVHVEATRRFG